MKDLKDQLINRFMGNLPPELEQLSEEAKQALRNGMRNLFEKAELVTREEFDAQTQVLERNQEKLSRLENLLHQLEAQHGLHE